MLLIEALRAKDKPFAVLDTHAGIGRYDLTGPEARKTGEFRDGIGRLLAAGGRLPPALAAYVDLVRAENAGAAEPARSEEHTSELQSLMRSSYAVFCLKKKTKQNTKVQETCV